MRIEKQQLIEDISFILQNSSFLFLITYQGLKVRDFNELRASLEDAGVDCHVLKNRLLKKSAEMSDMQEIASMELNGTTALISGNGDPGQIAKIISEFAKTRKQVTFKGGYLNNTLLSGQQVEAISHLPSREVLLGQLLATLEAPKRNMVSLLNTKLSGIVYLLNAHKDKINK